MRVLVVHEDGTPFSMVDSIKLTSHGIHPNVGTPSMTNLPLIAIDPAASCQPLRFDFETALPPTDPLGSFYDLRVKVGSRFRSIDFTLAACEFKQIEIPLESTSGRPREDRNYRSGARTPAQR
jgi:hypothetical protein